MTTTTHTSPRDLRSASRWRSTTHHLAGLGLSLAALCSATSAQGELATGPSPLPPPPGPAAQTAPPQQLSALAAPTARPIDSTQPGYGAQPAYAALAGQPAAPQPPGDTLGQTTLNPRRRAGLVPVLRAGFIMAGAGQIREECSGDLCASNAAATTEYGDASGPALIGADLLFHIGPDFRLGPGALYLPKTSWDIDGSSTDFEAGSELAVLLVGEGVFDLSSKVALSVRGFIGADILFPGGDLKDSVQDRSIATAGGSIQCADFNRVNGASCRRGKQPFVGPTYGGGVGLLIPTGSVALRVELMFQAYEVHYSVFELSIDGAGEGSFQGAITGTRSLLAAGIEF